MAVATSSWAATTYYSQGSLDATVTSSWNSNRGGGGTTPTDFTTTGDVFVIQSGHSMTTATGSKWPSSGTINTILIESGGTLTATMLIAVATFQVDDGGTYVHNAVGSGSGGSANDFPGTTRSLGASSNVEIQKWANGSSPAALPAISWGNLTINVTGPANGNSWQQAGNLSAVNGDFTLKQCVFPSFRLAANSPSSVTCNVGGNLAIQSGTFTASSGTATVALNVGGDLMQTGGIFQSTGVTTVTFTGGSSSGVVFTSSAGTLTSTNLHWGVASGKTLTFNSTGSTVSLGDLAVAGSAEITSGSSPVLAGATTIAGSASITVDAGGALYAAGLLTNNGAMTVNGTLRFNSGGSFAGTAPTYGGSSTLLYARAGTVGGEWGAGSATGPGVPQNVQIKLEGLSSALVLPGDRAVPGQLGFFAAGGVVTTGSHVLSIGSASAGAGYGWVNGNEQMRVSSSTPRIFDIGDATSYTPVRVTFSSISATGNLTVGVAPSAHPNLGSSAIDPAKYVKRYWTIASGGVAGTYGVTFKFLAGDIQGGADYTKFIAGRYADDWTYPTVGMKGADTTQVTGLSTFGDFAIGEWGRWIVKASATAGGSISPSGSVPVSPGGSQSFTASASPGYHLVDLVVDNVSQGAISSYSFSNVAADHTIRAHFVSDAAPVDLVARWPMDEGSGLGVGDASGHGNDGTLPSGSTWPAGVAGTALGLNGTSQYALVPPSNTLDLTTAITLAAWIRPSALTTQDVIAKAVATGTDGYELDLSSAGHPFVRLNQLSQTPRLDASALYPTDGNTWMHVAATYDGEYMRIFINGIEDNSSTVSSTLTIRTNTLPLAIGAQVDASGVASRFFQGAIDDARVYGRALSAVEIRVLAGLTTYTIEAAAGTGGSISPSGTVYVVPGSSQTFTIAASPGYGIADVLADGASVGAVATYTFDDVNADHTIAASFSLRNAPPAQPVVVAPADDATGVSTSPSLDVGVSDPDGNALTVTYYARPAGLMVPAPEFSIVVLPDAQNYTGSVNGGSPAILDGQTQWIVDSLVAHNTAYVAQVGDLSQNGDRYESEWQAADAAFQRIENPSATGMPDGLPYGVAVGNHEQIPYGATTFYNQYFGVARFAGRGYYGGHYGVNNNDHFDLWSAGGMDFLAIYIEIADPPITGVLSWADNLLKAYPSRRGIVVSHYLIDPGDPGPWGTQGQAIYDALKGDSNLFLMLCGHMTEEAKRADTYGGSTVNTLLADYQDRSNGGDGWLRILEFSPTRDVIQVKTYSPKLDQWETDEDSDFSLAYDMPATMPAAFAAIGTVAGVASGATSSLPWPGRDPSTAYEWYVTVSDGEFTTAGPTWTFTTGSGGAPEPVANLHATQATAGNDPDRAATSIGLAWDPTPSGTTVEVWRAGFGHYPEYGSGGGAEPAAPPAWSDPPAAGWAKAGTVTAPTAALTDLTEARDFYYYVAFVRDGAGTWSAGSAMTGGTLNYLLGDVAPGGETCGGDNWVGTADVSLLGAGYGAATRETGYLACLDVGPTAGYALQGRPEPDGVLEFEDLVLFALNYTMTRPSALGAAPLAAGTTPRATPAAGADRVDLVAPAMPAAGGSFTATLRASGKGDVQALGIELSYDRAVVEMEQVQSGELLARQGAPSVVLSPRPGRVDAALLGAGAGLSGAGALASVTFKVLSAGDTKLRIASVDARDARNKKVALTAGTAPAIPAVTKLDPARPNPFAQSVTLSFSLAQVGPAELVIYSVSGRRVRTLAHGAREAGEYGIEWDGRDDAGNAVGAGVYYAHLTTAHGRFTRRLIYLQ